MKTTLPQPLEVGPLFDGAHFCYTCNSAVDFVVDSLEGESFSFFFWGGAGLVLMRSKDGCSENSHLFFVLSWLNGRILFVY